MLRVCINAETNWSDIHLIKGWLLSTGNWMTTDECASVVSTQHSKADLCEAPAGSRAILGEREKIPEPFLSCGSCPMVRRTCRKLRLSTGNGGSRDRKKTSLSLPLLNNPPVFTFHHCQHSPSFSFCLGRNRLSWWSNCWAVSNETMKKKCLSHRSSVSPTGFGSYLFVPDPAWGNLRDTCISNLRFSVVA